MARTRSKLTAGTVILDSEGLSKWCAADLRVTAILKEAQSNDFRVSTSAVTPLEAFDSHVTKERLRWHLSRLRIEPVTEEVSIHALDLLRDSGLHGRKYAIDAVVAATALRSTRPVIILTSDEDDMGKLCGKAVRLVRV